MTYYSEKRDLETDPNAAFYFQQAFTGIFWYLHKGKNTSTFQLKNIIYESMLEDLSPLDILRYGPEIVNIFKNIEEIRTSSSIVDIEKISEVSKLGLQIYQVLSSCLKTKELAFYNAILQNASENNFTHPFIKTLKDLKKVSLNSSDKKWEWFKDFEKTNLFALALEWFRLNDSDQLEEENAGDVEMEYLPFPKITLNKTLPTPTTKYKATSTGIFFNEIEISIALATNILKRSFHIGLPIYDFKNFITNRFTLGEKVNVDLPSYYLTNIPEDYKRILIFCLRSCDVEFFNSETLFSVAYPLILMSESTIPNLAQGKV